MVGDIDDWRILYHKYIYDVSDVGNEGDFEEIFAKLRTNC